MNLKEKLYEKFERYVKIDTQSDDKSSSFPTTSKQFDLLKLLAEELKRTGASDVNIDKWGYVTASIPANTAEKKPAIGFLAHVDTSPDAPGAGVIPQIHRKWNGDDININKDLGIILNTTNCPELAPFKGEDIITASGETLLGADDKAGIAIIMTAAEYLLSHPEIKHGEIKIAFTPDEEVGQGVDHFDVKAFGADYAYTFDGDVAGCIEMENFNAHAVSIKITGKSVHPGTAKNSLANAIRIAGDIIASWPENLLPENAEGREGFIMFTDLNAEIEKAELKGIVREHDSSKLLEMEKQLEAIVAAKRYKYPAAKIEISFREQYRNMIEIINQHPEVMEKLKKAVRMAGLEPKIKPVRGGTDGARLSFMGLPTPNIFTGGYNYHGRYEWVSLDGMNKSAEVLLNLARLWAE